MKLSVIIRAYNEEEHIERLLLGISAQRLQPHEIILVDSGSTDRTREVARRFTDKIIHIDKMDFTFGRALNNGIAAASGDICVIPSAHVYPLYATWLEGLVAPFKDSRVVLSYGRQTGDARTKFSEQRLFERWFPADSAVPQRGYFCNNANCAIRRDTWQSLPYDEALTGLEDLAWAKAAQTAGGWLAYVADAIVAHVHDETWAQVQNRYRREALAMRQIDEHAHFTLLDLAWLLPAHIVTDMAAAARRGLLWRELRSIALFRYNQMLGTYRGYHGPTDVSAQLRARFYFPSRPDHEGEDAEQRERHRIDYGMLKASTDSKGRVVRMSGDKR